MHSNPELRLPPGRVGLASRAQRGMTLIEIMVVVAIIGLIMGGVGIMAFNRLQDAALATAKSETKKIQAAIDTYRVSKKGKCPKTFEDLKAAQFIDRVPKDPWDKEFQFKCPGEKAAIDVISAGPDGEFDTPDDIANYETEQADAANE
ncbi:MAG: type II secretion system protein GspG [Nannocystaceae bacterium]